MSRALRCCCCCSALPLSLLVLLGALLLPHLAPPNKCVEDGAGACTYAVGDARAPCSEGVFIWITRQPTLGLRHVAVEGEVPLAELSSRDCTVRYTLTCGSGAVEVREAWTCGGHPHRKGPPPKPLGRTWGSCATSGTELRLTQPVFDLTWDVETRERLPVHGCIEVTAVGGLPHLAGVRGQAAQQQAALVARKKAVGGCPTWQSQSDAVARALDFAVGDAPASPAFALLLREYVRAQVHYAEDIKREGFPEVAPKLPTVLFFAAMGASGFNLRTFAKVAQLNCGEPQPFGVGPSFWRYRDAEAIIGDPTLQREYKFGGNVVSELCFDPSLALFQSSGSPEHTQVRKLWDAVRFNSIHEGDLPDLEEAPRWGWTSLAGVRQVRSALGLATPLQAEVGQLVVPLVLERLWGARPGQEQLELFAQYLDYGALCIQSKAIERLPWLPGKIRAIREAMLGFGLGSPTAEALARLLELPEYAAVRRQYEARGRPVLQTAVQNLADASMFAGTLGTTVMAHNCVKALWKDPAHVRMFRANATRYLWELMRYRTAVAGSGFALKRDLDVNMFLVNLTVPAGTWSMAVLGGASGHDSSVFPEADRFDPDRPNIGEMLTWNGKLKHALAGDYSSPRYCPGQRISVKIAAHVCRHLTKHLPATT